MNFMIIAKSALMGGIFSVLIALKLKFGINPFGEAHGEWNNSGKRSLSYYLSTQVILGIFIWPAIVCLYLYINGLREGGQIFYLALALALLVIGYLSYRFVVKSFE